MVLFNDHSNAQASSSTPTFTNPPAGAQTPRKHKFGFSEIANLFIKLRRHQRRATVSQRSPPQHSEFRTLGLEHDSECPPETPASADRLSTSERTCVEEDRSSRSQSLSPPSSPSRIRVRGFSPYSRSSSNNTHHPKAAKPHHAVSCSGAVPISHPGMKESVQLGAQAMPIEYTDRFDCVGGVNVPTLLRATRHTLLETVEALGANALLDELWDCTICGPKHGVYKVEVHYSASATRCSKPDPHRPVALDQAKGIEGLMTILKRED